MEVKAYQKYLLYSVISLTVLLRFYHKYQWPIWGSDSGEYLYLTRHLVNEGMMLNENYIGWGRALGYGAREQEDRVGTPPPHMP